MRFILIVWMLGCLYLLLMVKAFIHYVFFFSFLDISLILNFLFKISDILIVFVLISTLTSVFKINKQVMFILF